MVMLTFLNYERSYVKILKKNISNFEFALSRAKTRQAAQEKEPFYVQRNLQSIIQHLHDIKNANPSALYLIVGLLYISKPSMNASTLLFTNLVEIFSMIALPN